MSTALKILMPRVMPVLIEMRHIMIETPRKTARTRAKRFRRTGLVIGRALRPLGGVLRSLLTVRAPAARTVE